MVFALVCTECVNVATSIAGGVFGLVTGNCGAQVIQGLARDGVPPGEVSMFS